MKHLTSFMSSLLKGPLTMRQYELGRQRRIQKIVNYRLRGHSYTTYEDMQRLRRNSRSIGKKLRKKYC